MDVEGLITQLEAACAALGVEVVDAELLRGGATGRSAAVLRVTVDRPHAPLDLDAVAAVSAVVSEALDEDGSYAPEGRYDLEVTSPGLERRLRRPGHFRAALGTPVSVKTRPGVPGERRVEGSLQDVDEQGISIAAADGTRRIAFGEIEQAHTVFDWRAALAARSRHEQQEQHEQQEEEEGVARR
jgi:ribosome maturation factor RimP